MAKNVSLQIVYWLQHIFGPDLAMASWKILGTIVVFALFSFLPSFMQGTFFCGDYGYPFTYAEGYGPCHYNNLCQDFYPIRMVYVIIISYVVSCILVTFMTFLPAIVKKIKLIKTNSVKKSFS